MKRFVLTGGSCAGKTTALVRIIDYNNYNLAKKE